MIHIVSATHTICTPRKHTHLLKLDLSNEFLCRFELRACELVLWLEREHLLKVGNGFLRPEDRNLAKGTSAGRCSDPGRVKMTGI